MRKDYNIFFFLHLFNIFYLLFFILHVLLIPFLSGSACKLTII